MASHKHSATSAKRNLALFIVRQYRRRNTHIQVPHWKQEEQHNLIVPQREIHLAILGERDPNLLGPIFIASLRSPPPRVNNRTSKTSISRTTATLWMGNVMKWKSLTNYFLIAFRWILCFVLIANFSTGSWFGDQRIIDVSVNKVQINFLEYK